MGRPKLQFDDLYLPVTESGCWIWIGATQQEPPYPYFSAGREMAHRYSYIRAFGTIPAEACVCHKCDVPMCVNPAHLFLGSTQENTADKVRKGRQARGSALSKAKLTESDVVAILASHEPCFVIARRYGITDTAVSLIKLGKTWKHVPRPPGYSYVPYRSINHRQWLHEDAA